MQAIALRPYANRPAQRQSGRRFRRRRSLCLLAVLVVVLGVLVLVPRAVYMMARAEAPAMVSYTVTSGDTLWEIATRYGTGEDVRKVIYTIEQANHLHSANVQPGQVLLIPQNSAR